MEKSSTIVWKPLSYILDPSTESFALVILNGPINIKEDIMVTMWNKATSRVTVDGGTDQWLKWLKSANADVINSGLPDLVTGDFDSIQPETLTMLQGKPVQIVHTPDQLHTDFTKAVKCLQEKIKLQHIVAICEVHGRLDQTLSQLNTLFLCDAPIVLLSSRCATWLLKPGNHEIHVENLLQNPLLAEDRTVGLLPIGAPATVTTSGLKWNLDNHQMKFGGLVSSSNSYDGEPVIKVSTDQPLIWTMSLSLGH